MSPWWYRGRTWVFAALYFAGFFLGGLVSAKVYGYYVPAFLQIGRQLGPAGRPALLIFAAVCAALCYAIRVWGSSYLRASTVWNPDALGDKFVVAGPFCYVRNPLYLGNMFLALGVGLMAPLAGFLFILMSNVWFIIALSNHEAILLERTYGAVYREYAAAVPALVPRLWPVAKIGNVQPSLVQGLLAEVFTAALLLGIILSIVDRRHGELDFFVLYVTGIVAQRIVATAQRRAT